MRQSKRVISLRGYFIISFLTMEVKATSLHKRIASPLHPVSSTASSISTDCISTVIHDAISNVELRKLAGSRQQHNSNAELSDRERDR